MKNKIISLVASILLLFLPQLVYADEINIKDEDKKDKKPAESTGSAAGSDASASAAGGVSLGTVAAIAAIAAAALAIADSSSPLSWSTTPLLLYAMGKSGFMEIAF